jgi:hypothetical protein
MSYREVVVESGEKIDALTQMLCYLCASLYIDGKLEQYGNKQIVAWHQRHMHEDEVRVGLEMQKIFREHPERMNHTDEVAEEFLQKALAVHPVSDFHRAWFKRMATEAAEAFRETCRQDYAEEKVKSDALAKLTPEERRALGLE